MGTTAIMTAEELAKIQFASEESEREAVNAGTGSIQNPGLRWLVWKWEQVSEEGRAFKVAVARRVLEKLKGNL